MNTTLHKQPAANSSTEPPRLTMAGNDRGIAVELVFPFQIALRTGLTFSNFIRWGGGAKSEDQKLRARSRLRSKCEHADDLGGV